MSEYTGLESRVSGEKAVICKLFSPSGDSDPTPYSKVESYCKNSLVRGNSYLC